jgi:hypothetical protein
MMAKQMQQLLARHSKLCDDIWRLMPKHYIPDPNKGERWDSEFAEAEGSLLACTWRKVIHDLVCSNKWLLDLTVLLDMKADDAKRHATPFEATDLPNCLDTQSNQSETASGDCESV